MIDEESMMARRKYVVGNWKMNGLTEALGEAGAIFAAARAHSGVDVALCLPFTLIGAMAALPEGGTVGGQDCHALPSGARSEEHTSELQSLMRLSYAGCRLKKKQ